MALEVSDTPNNRYKITSVGQATPQTSISVSRAAPVPKVVSVVNAPTYNAPLQVSPAPVNLPKLSFPELDYNKIDLSVDSNTHAVNFSAPDWYIDTPEFQNDVKPILEQASTMPIDSPQFKSIVNGDALKGLREQASALKIRHDAINNYINSYSGSDRDNAMTFLQNVAASNASDKDTTTQVVLGYDKNNKPVTSSVAEVVNTLKGWDDRSKANFISNHDAIINDPNATQANKAAARGILAFAQNKGLLNAGAGTKALSAVAGVAAGLGKAFEWAPIVGSHLKEDVDSLNKSMIDITQLKGAGTYYGVGNLAGSLGAIATNIVLGNKIAGVAEAGALLGLSKFKTGAQLVGAAKDVIGVNKISGAIIKDIPNNLAFGALDTLSNPERGANGFVEDMVLNAAGLGAFKGAGPALKALDTSTNGALRGISTSAAAAAQRAFDAVSKVPGFKQVRNWGTVLRANAIEGQAGIKRALRTEFGQTKDEGKLVEGYNVLQSATKNGGSIVAKMQISDAVAPAYTKVGIDATALAWGKQKKAFAQYAKARSLLAHDVNGKMGFSDSTKKELQKMVDEHADNELFNEAYNNLSEYSTKSADWFANSDDASNLFDKATLDEVRSAANIEDYTPLVAKTKARAVRPRTKPKEITPIQTTKGAKGKSVDEILDHYENPFTAVQAKNTQYASDMAQNRVSNLVSKLVDDGYIRGEEILSPELNKTIREGAQDLANEKHFFTGEDITRRGAKGRKITSKGASLFDEGGVGEKWIDDLATKLEDIDTLSGKAYDDLSSTITDMVDKLVNHIKGAPEFKNIIARLMDNGVKDEATAAAEIIKAYKKDFLKTLNDRLLKATRSGDEADLGARIFSSKIDDAATLARAKQAGEAVETADEVTGIPKKATDINIKGDREKEIKDLKAQIGIFDDTDSVIVPYYRNGEQGFYRVDDPVVASYLISPHAPQVDSVVQNIATGITRAFKAGTTTFNPAFILTRNLPRDIGSGTTMASLGMIDGRTFVQQLVRRLGYTPEQAEALLKTSKAEVSNATFVASGRVEKSVNQLIAEGYTHLPKNVGNLGKRIWHGATREPLRALEAPGQKVEEFTRNRVFAVTYADTLQRTGSESLAMRQAVFMANEATANFLNTGLKASSIIRTVPYLQAAINGATSFVRLATIDPLGVGMRITAGYILPMTYIYSKNMANNSMAAGYFDIPEYIRSQNLVIMLDDKNYVTIALPQEILPFTNSLRVMMEAAHGRDGNIMGKLFDALSSNSPIDVSGFNDTGVEGGVNVGMGFSRALSGIMPQYFNVAYQVATGKNPYTGNPLGPDDASSPQEDTFEGKNSFLLGKLARITGMPQSKIQAVYSGLTGGLGQNILNIADKLAGAPEEQQGGKGLLDNIAQNLLGVPSSQANQDYWQGYNKLVAQKQRLSKEYDTLYYDIQNGDKESEDKWDAATQQFQQAISDFYTKYSDYYSRAGGFQPYQLKQLTNLLDFETQKTAKPGTVQAADIQQANYDAQDEAKQQAFDMGLPITNTQDLYGRVLKDTNGKVSFDYSNTTSIPSILKSQYYGVPRQIATEFDQAVGANKKAGTKSLNSEMQSYYDRLDKLYDQAKGLHGDAATAIYNQISAVQEKYMTDVFDPRIKPLIDKYGAAVLTNSKVLDELQNLIMVPSDFTPFASKKRQPYRKDDTRAYLLDRYGVGSLNKENFPTDKEADQLIQKINNEINAGRPAAAKDQYNSLLNKIRNNQTYVDPDQLQRIAAYVGAMNKY